MAGRELGLTIAEVEVPHALESLIVGRPGTRAGERVDLLDLYVRGESALHT